MRQVYASWMESSRLAQNCSRVFKPLDLGGRMRDSAGMWQRQQIERRKSRHLPRTWIAVLSFCCAVPAAQPALSTYGNYHTVGITVDVAAGSDADRDATATVEYRTAGGAYRSGFPLTRISDTRFVGSLFWLTPGTTCDVRVTLADPDGGVLNGVVLTTSTATRSEPTVPAPLRSVYVSAAGNDTAPGDGSPAHPYATLARAFQSAQPGDHIILRGGIYYQGEVSPSASGTSGAPIVVTAYPGETVILDGADPSTVSWTASGAGIYHTTVAASDPHLIACDGERLFPYQSYSDMVTLRWGTPGFFVASGTSVSVHLAGGADPAAHAVAVSRCNYALRVSGRFHVYQDLTFRHYGCGDYAKAVYVDDGDDIVFRNCTFTMNDIGIGFKRDAHRNLIEQCTFSDSKKDWNWDGVKTTGDLEAGAIAFYDPVTGRGNVIRRNTFHNFFDGFGCSPESAGPLTNETDVYENLVYDCGDDAFEVDGHASNVRIWGNTIHDVLAGISVAPVYAGPVYAIRNVIYRTGVGNNTYSGLSFKFNSGYGASGAIYLFHNTCDAALPGNDGLAIHSPGSWAMIQSRNNIWAGTQYAIYNANPTQPIDFDYDNMHTTLSGELAWWSNLPDRHIETLAELRSVLGLEMHGMNELPGFVAPAGGNYALAPGSALIDRATILPGINDAYSGSVPDIGAFEFLSTAAAEKHWLNMD